MTVWEVIRPERDFYGHEAEFLIALTKIADELYVECDWLWPARG